MPGIFGVLMCLGGRHEDFSAFAWGRMGKPITASALQADSDISGMI